VEGFEPVVCASHESCLAIRETPSKIQAGSKAFPDKLTTQPLPETLEFREVVITRLLAFVKKTVQINVVGFTEILQVVAMVADFRIDQAHQQVGIHVLKLLPVHIDVIAIQRERDQPQKQSLLQAL
jgi:hypothetical protein